MSKEQSEKYLKMSDDELLYKMGMMEESLDLAEHLGNWDFALKLSDKLLSRHIEDMHVLGRKIRIANNARNLSHEEYVFSEFLGMFIDDFDSYDIGFDASKSIADKFAEYIGDIDENLIEYLNSTDNSLEAAFLARKIQREDMAQRLFKISYEQRAADFEDFSDDPHTAYDIGISAGKCALEAGLAKEAEKAFAFAERYSKTFGQRSKV